MLPLLPRGLLHLVQAPDWQLHWLPDVYNHAQLLSPHFVPTWRIWTWQFVPWRIHSRSVCTQPIRTQIQDASVMLFHVGQTMCRTVVGFGLKARHCLQCEDWVVSHCTGCPVNSSKSWKNWSMVVHSSGIGLLLWDRVHQGQSRHHLILLHSNGRSISINVTFLLYAPVFPSAGCLVSLYPCPTGQWAARKVMQPATDVIG